jgi:hypothetical protein
VTLSCHLLQDTKQGESVCVGERERAEQKHREAEIELCLCITL